MLDKKWLADQILQVEDNYYMKGHFYNLLYQIVINRFIWKNLPNLIDPDFIERELANNGELAFINHQTFGYVVTQCVGDGYNLYNRPTKYLCYTSNYAIYDFFDADDIVIIRNNKLGQPSNDFINRYASNIAQIQKTKEININAQKTPILISCDENQKLDMKNFYAEYEGNAPVIYGYKNSEFKEVKVFKTDAPFLADKLQEVKMDEFNECLTFMGINTVPEKKERMLVNEVDANNDMVNICLSMFLNSRKQAVEDINKKFGLNIELELAEYCKSEYEPVSSSSVKEGVVENE